MPNSRARRAALGLLALVAAGTFAWGSAGPAAAATPTLAVSPNVLSPDATATVTVAGSGYLVPPHLAGADVFGGVYVFFGWVRPGGPWGPSSRNAVNDGGQFGTTYTYPGADGGADTRDDGSGLVRLVSFTAGGLSGTSTAFHMDDNGNWSTSLTIHGATFSWTDPVTAQLHPVDCRLVQCGVFTIGAHGKASSTNEVFTPVAFANTPTGANGTPSGSGGGSPSSPGSPGATVPPSGAKAGTSPARPSATATGQSPTATPGVTTTLATGTTVPADAASTTTVDPSTVSTLVGSPSTTTATGRSTERADSVRIPQGDGGGGGGWAWAGGAAGVAVAAGAGGAFWLRRRRP